jgi:hypothetical protein
MPRTMTVMGFKRPLALAFQNVESVRIICSLYHEAP